MYYNISIVNQKTKQKGENNMQKKYKLTVINEDGGITYESTKAEEIIQQLKSLQKDETQEIDEKKEENNTQEKKPMTSLYERTRSSVYSRGNRWAIENFNATHN